MSPGGISSVEKNFTYSVRRVDFRGVAYESKKFRMVPGTWKTKSVYKKERK